MTTLQFGGITVDEDYGTGFHLTRLVGWYDAAPTRYSAAERPQAHGSFRPGKIFRAPRVVSVEGSWSGDTIEEAYVAQQALAGVQADGYESPMTVTDVLGSTTVTAGLSGAPTMDDQLYSPFFRFAFDVIAADPFRYGPVESDSAGVPTPSTGLSWPLGSPRAETPDVTTGPFWDWGTDGETGRVQTANVGNAETFSTFDVTGGLSGGFLLTWVPTGDEIRFERTILDGSVVNVDPRTGRATIDGQSDVSGYLTRANWWPIAAGQTGEVQFTPLGTVTGTPTLTAHTRPAYP